MYQSNLQAMSHAQSHSLTQLERGAMSILDNITPITADFTGPGDSNKDKVTDEELLLGRQVCLLVFRVSNLTDVEGEPISDERVNALPADVVEAFVKVNKEEAESDWNAQRWCRAILKVVHKAQGHKERHWPTHSRILCEGAINEKLMTKEEARAAFRMPKYKRKNRS